MRVEPAPYVFRNDDRREQPADRRAAGDDRRTTQPETFRRAQHAAHLWLAPAFGAHLLGQAAPSRANASQLRRAYAQPEASTPLRPSIVKSV